MKEIKEIFKTTKTSDIKRLLEKIISKIESEDRETQNKLLEEFIEEARKTNKTLKKGKATKGAIYYYQDEIAPLAVLAEEVTIDSYIEKDMLKILKFNLNKFFKQFKEAKEGDWYIDTETLKRALQILELESNFISMLEKKGIELSIFSFNSRFRNDKIELVNYDIIYNSKFAIHLYRSNEQHTEDKLEVCFEQFGYLLKEILVGESQKVPDGFVELFDKIDIPKIDEESKEALQLFAATFAHYIIEKMEIKVTKKLGKGWKEHVKTRNEEFVKNMLQYFDNIFSELMKENEELPDDNECPCGSGKKYKNCCKKKNFKYIQSEEEHKIQRAVPIHPELEKGLRQEKIRFKKLFGRTPGDNDFVLGGVLEKDLKRSYKIMKREGNVDKAWLYASNKTGLMLSKENMDLLPQREINEFMNSMKEYEKIMKSKVKNNRINELQAIEAVSFMLEHVVNDDISNMIYVLNVFINSYSKRKQSKENFIIENIKDFLVFCAYKTTIYLQALQELVNGEYYDNAMATDRTIFEILINIKAYKNEPELFKEKILPVAGVDIGTHRRINRNQIEEIETGRIYKYEIQKSQLAEKAGENYKKLYDTFYRQVSEFIHLDTGAAKNIFKDNDLFDDIDECLIAGFLGAILSLEIIMELIEFEGCENRISKDLKYFSNILLKDILAIIKAVILIDDWEVYKILESTLKEYKTNYKINYQRGHKYENV